jgi:hypothetical protein
MTRARDVSRLITTPASAYTVYDEVVVSSASPSSSTPIWVDTTTSSAPIIKTYSNNSWLGVRLIDLNAVTVNYLVVAGGAGGTGGDSGGGGGGGAGGAGNNGGSTTGGSGGVGITTNISGSSLSYGGGGGGGKSGSASSGGGAGNGSSGTANTGGGGGGNATGTSPGNGGSGIVIIRFPDTYSLSVGAGLTSSNSTANGFKTFIFTSGTGTVTFS